MMVSRASPLLRTVSAWPRWISLRGVSSSSPVMPMMPFIGVRISWLIIARKSLLARLAASAASLAAISARRASVASVMSTTVPRCPVTAPLPPWAMAMVAQVTCASAPSGRR